MTRVRWREGTTLRVKTAVHRLLRDAAKVRGVGISDFLESLILAGIALEPPPPPAPAPPPEPKVVQVVRVDEKPRACRRCEKTAAFCPACYSEAQDVAVVQNRLVLEERRERLQVAGGRA